MDGMTAEPLISFRISEGHLIMIAYAKFRGFLDVGYFSNRLSPCRISYYAFSDAVTGPLSMLVFFKRILSHIFEHIFSSEIKF